MFAIVTRDGENEVIFYGPFSDRAAVERYAMSHEIVGMYVVVKLHDSGDAMEA